MLKVAPNNVTWSMLFFGCLGSWFYSLGSLSGYVLGSCWFIVLNIADTADGELARLQQETSTFGEYLDRLCHYFTNSLMCLGLGLGLYADSANTLYLFLASVACCCYVLDDASKDLLMMFEKDARQTRAEISKSISLSKNSRLIAVALHLFAHSSIWHVLPVVAVLDMFLTNIERNALSLSVIYIVMFLCSLPVRAFFRLRKVRKNYGL